jgi:DMSO/TMAO reductase YedYZ molybdopterin-dependent catalytic subunit
MSSLPSADMRTARSLPGLGALVALAFLFVPAAHAADGRDANRVTTTLAVRGNVSAPLSLTVGDLRKFPEQRVEDTRMVRGQDNDNSVARQFAGCLLRDVLNSARLTERDRFDLRKSIIVATASDGYKAVFSWAELFNSAIGDGVLIVYERDGKPLDDDEGRIALVSLKDTRPGPRHVKWLSAVEVVRIAD